MRRTRCYARASACSRSAQSSSQLLEPDREAQQPVGIRSPSQRWRASSFDRVPPRLVAFSISVDARSTRPRGVAVGDVERDEEGEARVADGLDSRVRREALREQRAPLPPAGRGAPRASSSPRSTSHAVSAEATIPASRRVVWSRSQSASSRVTVTPASTSSWPARTFVAEWSTTSQPCSRGRRRKGEATVASQTTGAGWATAASRSGIVSSGFAGASTRIRSAPSGGACVWSNSTTLHAPRREVVEEHAVAVVRALRERDRLSGPKHRQHDGRHRAHPGRVEERVAAVERAERLLAGDARRMVGRARTRTGPARPSSYGQVAERSSGASIARSYQGVAYPALGSARCRRGTRRPRRSSPGSAS